MSSIQLEAHEAARVYTISDWLQQYQGFQAVLDSGYRLHESGPPNLQYANWMGAVYYVGGIYETYEGHCGPDRTRWGQLGLVVAAWVKRHPERLHLSASVAIQNAFLDAYPCKETK